jgi:hypothetical protein
MNTAARSEMDSCVGNCRIVRPPPEAASRQPMTPVMNAASANAHSL